MQKSASIQPRTSPSKFGGKFISLFTSLLRRELLECVKEWTAAADRWEAIRGGPFPGEYLRKEEKQEVLFWRQLYSAKGEAACQDEMERLSTLQAPPQKMTGSWEHLTLKCWACGGFGHFSGWCPAVQKREEEEERKRKKRRAEEMAAAEREEKEAKRQQMLRGLQWLKERAEQVRKRKAELAEQERQRKAEEAEEKKRKQDRERCVRLVEQFIERMRSLKKPKAALLVTPLPKRKYTKHKQKGEKFGEYNNGKLGKIRTKKYTGSDKGREAAAARKRRQREREKNAKTTTKKAIKKTTH